MLNVYTRHILILMIAVVWSFSLYGKEHLTVNWQSDAVIVSNPYDSVTVNVNRCDVEITSIADNSINVLLEGECNDGSVRIKAPSSVNLVLDNLSLKSEYAACIDIQSKKKNVLTISGDIALEDSERRDSTLEDDAKGAIYTTGELTINGTGQLSIEANYKHGIYAEKALKIKDVIISILGVPNDGIRGKKDVSISNSTIYLNKIGKHAINSDKSTLKIKNSRIEAILDNVDSKGIASTSDLECDNSFLTFTLNGNATKGIKCDANVILKNDSIIATAIGNIILERDDKTYCTIIKCDSSLVANDCFVSINHEGEGGKGISCDAEMSLSNCEMDITLSGNGAPYISYSDGNLDFYTPKCLESEGEMHLISGKYKLHASGNGGKGIVCDSLLVIGQKHASNESLFIDILTEGSTVIEDIDNDQRDGCPKAIKCGNEAIIESGTVTSYTKGMGGEGLESKGTLTINGGVLICEAFDDGINVEKGIIINNGCVYCTSINNDGIDSNGFIELNGGVVVSLTSHEYDEDFDCDNENFYLNGGTILGVGRDYSGIYKVGQPYIQHVAVYKDRLNAINDTIDAFNIPKGKYLTFTDSGNRPILTALIHDDIPVMFATMSSDRMMEMTETNIYLTDCPPEGSDNLMINRIWRGGEPFQVAPLTSDLATLQPYKGSERVNGLINLYAGWNFVSPCTFGGIPTNILSGKASKIISEDVEYLYDSKSDEFRSSKGFLPMLKWNKSYLIEMTDDLSIEFSGNSIPMVMQYYVKSGWNHINFPHSKNLLLSEAFRMKFLSDGDYISDMHDFAIFHNGKWIGPLSELTPGKGYFFVTDYSKRIQFVY